MTVDSAASEFPGGLPADAWRALSVQADDTVVAVGPAGRCEWSSTSDGPAVDSELQDAFRPDDATLVAELLSPSPAGPVWLRLSGGAHADGWVSAVSVPRPDSAGWFVQLRSAPGVGEVPLDAAPPADQPSITGVAGRDRALDEVAWLLSATPRTGKEIAVACCGLDNFAAVRDQLGAGTGEEVLRVLAGRISDALRSGDLVARLEDDRLLVVLRGVHHLRGAIRVANKIRTAVEDPILLPSGELVQTASVGVTLISRGESVDSVLLRAEGAMAMSQDSGGNAVTSSPPI